MNIACNATSTERFVVYQHMMHEQGTLLFPGALLQRAAHLYPDRPAISFKGKQTTFEQTYKQSLRITAYVHTHNIQKYDHVCLIMENHEHYHAAYYGIWQTGAVVIPLNTFLTDKELLHIIHDAQPKLMIVSQEFAQRLQQMPDQHRLPAYRIASEIIEQGQDITDDYVIPTIDPHAMTVLLYTSGTTGFPKGVMLSSVNIMTNIAQILATVSVDHRDTLFGVLPLFHSFAQNVCVWSSVFMGALIIVIPKIERKWILQGLQEKPTVLMGVPAFYGLLCLMKHISLAKIRFLISGGDALPDKIRAGVELVYRRKLLNGYGLTETAPFIAADTHDILHDTNTIGKPACGITISIRDEQMNQLPAGEIGILWVKGDNVMLGYYNAPEATQEMVVDGWLNTGDFAYIDEEQNIILAGRYKDLIIHKGFNIYPQEIENVLLLHPDVFKAGVVGKEDEATGQIPVAFVAVRHQTASVEHELAKLCAQHLAAYKVPRRIICLSDLPMTSLAKVDKKKLRQQVAEGAYD